MPEKNSTDNKPMLDGIRDDWEYIQDDPDTSTLGLWFCPGPEHFEDWCKAMVYVRGCTGGGEGISFLTCECESADEFEAEIKLLKNELDLVAKRGRKMFEEADARFAKRLRTDAAQAEK